MMHGAEPIDLRRDLVNLATHRRAERRAGYLPDPLIVLVAYAQDELVYDRGRITTADPQVYAMHRYSHIAAERNVLVNKFGQVYPRGWPLMLHRRLADILVDVAIDLRDRHRLFTVVMDGLRTYEAGLRMQANRPDLVASGMLARAGDSAHNRALAVDSKLFRLIDPLSYETWSQTVPLAALEEADEHGHLDDEQDMRLNSRFYAGPMSATARKNRALRLAAWQRASIRHRTPIASLLAEFWDDRVPGSPADMWRVLTCRALCIGVDANPATSPAIRDLRIRLHALHERHDRGELPREDFAAEAYHDFTGAWHHILTAGMRLRLDRLLGAGGGSPPELADFLFHEWLANIHDADVLPLIQAG